MKSPENRGCLPRFLYMWAEILGANKPPYSGQTANQQDADRIKLAEGECQRPPRPDTPTEKNISGIRNDLAGGTNRTVYIGQTEKVSGLSHPPSTN